MTNFSAGRVESAIENHPDFDSWGEFKYAGTGARLLTLELDGESHPVHHVDDFGGEGQGDEIWVVIGVGTQLFRKSGYYASHYGSDWDGDLDEVRATQKTITVYE